MINLNIKPLSVNQAWKGRRFKTNLYNTYEKQLLLILPREIDIPEGKLSLKIEFGFSNKNSDIDNALKMFIDILQKKYGFNDNRIYQLDIIKTKENKGHEFINFNITQYSIMN